MKKPTNFKNNYWMESSERMLRMTQICLKLLIFFFYDYRLFLMLNLFSFLSHALDKDHNIFFLISAAIFNPHCVSPFPIFYSRFLLFALIAILKSWTDEWEEEKAQATSNSTTTTKVNFFLFLLKWKFLSSLPFSNFFLPPLYA